MKVNVLGTEYDYNITTDKEDATLCNKAGYCDSYAKIIAVESDFNEQHPDCIKNFASLKKKVIRHEFIHAFFAESGLDDYTSNEQLVDWIAFQFPKMLETFKKVDAI